MDYYTNADIITALQQHAVNARAPTSVEWDRARWRPSLRVVQARFGSWRAALAAAGLTHPHDWHRCGHARTDPRRVPSQNCQACADAHLARIAAQTAQRNLDCKQAIELYEQGMATPAIGTVLQRPHSEVIRMLHQAGVTMRGRGHPLPAERGPLFEPWRCSGCGGTGHNVLTCPQGGRSGSQRCSVCHQPDHNYRSCPLRS
jgi:hypothetical protein